MIVLAIVGMPGSGKSTAAQYLKKNKQVTVIYFGQVIIREILLRGLEVNASNGQMVREDLRSKQGMDICAKLSLPSIKAAMISGNIVVIDGLYSFSEYKTLRKEFHDKLVVVAIFCPRKLRYARLEIRKERPLTIFEAEMRDYAEIERIEKGGPIAMADYVIINDTTFEHFFHSIDQFFDKHLSELLSECSED